MLFDPSGASTLAVVWMPDGFCIETVLGSSGFVIWSIASVVTDLLVSWCLLVFGKKSDMFGSGGSFPWQCGILSGVLPLLMPCSSSAYCTF